MRRKTSHGPLVRGDLVADAVRLARGFDRRALRLTGAPTRHYETFYSGFGVNSGWASYGTNIVALVTVTY